MTDDYELLRPPLSFAREQRGAPEPRRPGRWLLALVERSGRRLLAGRSVRIATMLERHSLLRSYDEAFGFVQRGRRGWADSDLWAFDEYLTAVLAGGVRQIAGLSFGWNDRVWATHEEWVAELRQLADDLDALHSHLAEQGALADDDAERRCDAVFASLRRAYGHLRVD